MSNLIKPISQLDASLDLQTDYSEATRSELKSKRRSGLCNRLSEKIRSSKILTIAGPSNNPRIWGWKRKAACQWILQQW